MNRKGGGINGIKGRAKTAADDKIVDDSGTETSDCATPIFIA